MEIFKLVVVSKCPPGKQRCCRCKDYLDASLFSSSKVGYCRTCAREKLRTWKRANREKYNANARRLRLKALYGLSVERYEELMSVGKCAICGRTDVKLNLDHDHKNGQIREVLCINCNKGLGHFQDRPDLLQRAVLYLKAYTE